MSLKKLEALIKSKNKELNLLSAGDIKKLEEKHFKDSAAVMKFWKLKGAEKIIDIGTGGGLPGLVLADLNKKMNFLLLDSTKKKILAVKDMVKKAGMKNCKTLVGRCEEVAQDSKYREKFDVVTARALAPLPTLLEFASGFVKKGGKFFAWKGVNADIELKASKKAIKELSFKFVKKYDYKIKGTEGRCILEFEKIDNLNPKFPRNNGVPLKFPL